MLVNNKLYEMYYGIPQLIKRCQKITRKKLTGEDCLLLAKTNRNIKKIVNEWYDGLVKGIMNYIYIMNPEYIVLGGKITEDRNFDLKYFRSVMLKLAQKPLILLEMLKLLKQN